MGRHHTGRFCDPETGILTEDGYDLITQAAGLGSRDFEMAALLGISPTTFKVRKKADERLSAAIDIGKAITGLEIGKSLAKQAKAGNVNAIRWYEITRQGRAEKVEQEITERQFVVAAPPELSMDEWNKQYGPDTADG
jgi:hypothetical protein